jgi:hypothetical protein
MDGEMAIADGASLKLTVRFEQDRLLFVSAVEVDGDVARKEPLPNSTPSSAITC